MTEADISKLEAALGVSLPPHYRQFMLAYPQALMELKVDLGWSQESPAKRDFRSDPAALLELNRDVRQPGTPWIGEDGPWPDEYFVIGDDECGNYYCLLLDGRDSGVWFYDHEVGEFERHHDDLEAFANMLIEAIETFNREHGGK